MHSHDSEVQRSAEKWWHHHMFYKIHGTVAILWPRALDPATKRVQPAMLRVQSTALYHVSHLLWTIRGPNSIWDSWKRTTQSYINSRSTQTDKQKHMKGVCWLCWEQDVSLNLAPLALTKAFGPSRHRTNPVQANKGRKASQFCSPASTDFRYPGASM